MRACQPSRDGYVARNGVKVHYEMFGAGERSAGDVEPPSQRSA